MTPLTSSCGPRSAPGKRRSKSRRRFHLENRADPDPHPGGTPVDLLANINVYASARPGQALETLKRLKRDPRLLVGLAQALKNQGQYDDQLKHFVPLLLARSQSPDLIQDHGHTFGSNLPDDQKRALIEYMKTF